MKDNKCPSIDGLSKEFYVTFFEQLGPLVIQVYQQAFKHKQLNDSATMGLISLIPKKEKDMLYLGDWRPLMLLNLDYKILSKVMAECMRPII